MRTDTESADQQRTIPQKVAPRHDVIAWGERNPATGALPIYRADGSLWFVFDCVEKPVGCRIYFIGTGDGPIKIGFSNDPLARLRALQTASPYPLKLLATTRGGPKKEAEYHTRFAEHRMSGEWFSPHPSILRTIKRLTSTLNQHVPA